MAAKLNINSHDQDLHLAKVINAIGTEEFPPLIVSFLRQCIEFDNVIVLAYKGEDNPKVLYREYRDAIVYGAMDTEYVSAVYLLDPFYEAHLKGLGEGVHRLFDIAPDRFKQTSYFKVYYEKTTLLDEIAAFAKTESGCTITICIGTDNSSGRYFSKKDISSLQKFENVITALASKHWHDYDPKPHPEAGIEGSVVERLRKSLLEDKGIKLSRRQAEVAIFILQGHSSRSASLILGISVNTIKIFRRQLYERCNISSQAELFAMMLPLLAK